MVENFLNSLNKKVVLIRENLNKLIFGLLKSSSKICFDSKLGREL